MNSSRALTWFFLLSVPFASGCATIIHGSHQTISVTTTPPGATATCSDQVLVTPGRLRVSRSAHSLRIKVQLDGYQLVEVALTRSLSGSLWWNAIAVPVGAGAGAAAAQTDSLDTFSKQAAGAIAGGLVLPTAFLAVDFISGAAYQQKPAEINIVLTPAPRE